MLMTSSRISGDAAIGDISASNGKRLDAEKLAEYVSDLGRGVFEADYTYIVGFPNLIVLKRTDASHPAPVYGNSIQIARTGTREGNGSPLPGDYYGFGRRFGEIREVAVDRIRRILEEHTDASTITLSITPVETADDDYAVFKREGQEGSA